MEMEAVAIARRFRESEAGQALKQDRKGNLHFKPRQGCADAEMDAGPEAHMRAGLAPRIETVGIWKALWIAIGGAEQEADLVALAQFHTGNLDVFQGVAGEKMERRVVAQQFFDEPRIAIGA